ncbi:MAG: PIG-L family deacetylase [Candidatus Alcyoniella australis]|nr:PIG-L family deacetylase [Candidatus Alcyoniella australis]
MQDKVNSESPLVVLAAAAHPDDVEFCMAGTLLRLGELGAKLHIWNLASGSCGSNELDVQAIRILRQQEAEQSARIADARLHPPLVDDFELIYQTDLLRRVAAVLRGLRPQVMLIPSPEDYMEDHQNACRLLVSAAFVRGMRNFQTFPPLEPIDGEMTLYHAMPHGLRDGLRRPVRPQLFVDTTPVIARKQQMLEAHASQRQWLERSQGTDCFIETMLEQSRELGRLSGRFEHAEGWRRHNHLGFCAEHADPLSELLGASCVLDELFEHDQRRGEP